jgi:hypothetical protein
MRRNQTRRVRPVSPMQRQQPQRQTRRRWYNTLWDFLPFNKTAAVAPAPRTPAPVQTRPNLSAHRRREARRRKGRQNTRRNNTDASRV